MAKKVILITGANGQLGSELQFLSKNSSFDFVFTDYIEMDIVVPKSIENYFNQYKPSYLINCAAYTAVDKAETEVEMADKINHIGAANLAAACELHGATMLHVSTDYVYHNDHQNRPFIETDITSPKGVYAQTKLDGDNAVLSNNKSSVVVRTSWVYSTFGNNFVKTMMKLGTDRPALTVIFDQIGSPTYARDLAAALLHIVGKMDITKENYHGIYHFSNEGVTSWYDFAKAIFEIKNIHCNVSPIETVDYPTPASRPPFSLLNKKKIRTTFDLPIRHWKDALKECLSEL
jgi:dTDP-4-dehydrorhamnose reductase